jgi:hypothetical protein
MTSRHEIVERLRREPASPELWGVFGDMLEQEGDGRGALIAIEHAIARDGDRPELVAERERIEKACRPSWLAGLEGHLETGELGVRLELGFISRARAASVSASVAVLSHPSSCFLRALAIRTGSAPDLAPVLEAFARSPAVELDLSHCGLRRSDVRALLASPAIDRVEVLAIDGNRLGDWGVTDFERAARLHRVSRLGLADNGIGDRGIEWIARCPSVSSLAVLHLARSSFSDRGATAIAESGAFARLTVLDLASVPIGATGVATLAASPHLAGLTGLDVGSAGELGPPAIDALLGGRFRLESLNVSNDALGDAGAEAIAGHPGAGRLVELVAVRNDIGPAGALAMARSPHLSRLRRLDLYDNPIGDRALIAILEGLEHLTDLSVAPRHVGEAGAAAIERSRLSAASKDWFHLERERWRMHQR